MKFMEKNVGQIDRIVLGVIVAAGSYMYLADPLMYVGYLIALILLFTGVFGTCGLYSLFNINTCKI